MKSQNLPFFLVNYCACCSSELNWLVIKVYLFNEIPLTSGRLCRIVVVGFTNCLA